MTAILLAAGKGTRISRMIEAAPKCTLSIDGVPLIRKTVDLLASYNIPSIVCVGYQQHKVRTALEGTKAEFVENPFYALTNSIASLWFARNRINDDILIMNSDVYFDSVILENVLSDRNEVVMAIDETRVKTGDFFFATSPNGCIEKYGKGLTLEERTCEYVGIAKINSSFCDEFRERMISLIRDEKYDLWWENILYSYIDSGEYDIHTLDVGGRFWSEIDYFDDYERILNHLENENKLNNDS